MKEVLKSILTGIMIAIGGTVFLSVDNKVVGSLLFAIGLFVIVVTSLNLYTGKVGYIVNEKIKYIYTLLLIIGNFIGTFVVGITLRLTRVGVILSDKANLLTTIKLNDNLLSILILSIFCGILMYLAVNGYKIFKNQIAKYLVVILCVMVFILCGFEHSIANMYYFSIAGAWSLKTILYVLIMIIGNGIGAVIISLSEKYYKKNELY